MSALVAGRAPLVVRPEAEVAEVAGFDVHRGVLAAADRLPPPGAADLVAAADLVVVVEGVTDHENVGALFRNAAAFGAGAVLLDPTTADPLYRRSVRVSLGHVLRVPWTRLTSWPGAVHNLAEQGFAADAEPIGPVADALGRAAAPGVDGRRVALVVGAEGSGLSEAAMAAPARRVRIPLAHGVDSLNVATAAAVALHAVAGDRLG